MQYLSNISKGLFSLFVSNFFSARLSLLDFCPVLHPNRLQRSSRDRNWRATVYKMFCRKKDISNSCWQVLVGHEHLTGWIISAKKKKESWPPKVYRILTLVKVFPNFITDVIQTWTNEKTTWHLPLYLTVVTRISSKRDKQCTTNQLLYL